MNGARILYLLLAVVIAIVCGSAVGGICDNNGAGWFVLLGALALGIHFARGATTEAPKEPKPEGWSDEAWKQYLKLRQ